jgi:hypothetical protein
MQYTLSKKKEMFYHILQMIWQIQLNSLVMKQKPKKESGNNYMLLLIL